MAACFASPRTSCRPRCADWSALWMAHGLGYRQSVRANLALGSTDMRKGKDGLALLAIHKQAATGKRCLGNLERPPTQRAVG